MIRHIISGVLVSLFVTGTAVGGASALPASADLPHEVMHAAFDARRVTLQDGRHAPDEERGKLEINKPIVGEDFTNDVFTLSGAGYLSDATEFQIVMKGVPTGYWVRAALFTTGETHKAHCAVYFGAPSAKFHPADPSPFTCSTKMVEADPYDPKPHERWFTFSVGLNRDAEASGEIRAINGVSLHNGTFKTYRLPYARHGADSVASGGRTTFDTVLREGDTSPFRNQARTEFAYQIYNNAGATPFWVAGLSTNYRGGAAFNGDSRCAFYLGNPLAGEGRLDQGTPVDVDVYGGYTCAVTGSYVSGPHESGYGHYFAQFTIGKDSGVAPVDVPVPLRELTRDLSPLTADWLLPTVEE